MIAIYARQSVDKKDSISIETQIDMCRKEIPENCEFVVFKDKGFSGKNTDRPAFRQMMDTIRNGEITKVIVYRLDRISRSITDFANIFDTLSENGVDFVSTVERFDTSTPMGRAMLYIIMVFAQLERETIAERIRDNYYSRGKTGSWLGGPAPFGYQLVKRQLNGRNVPALEPNRDIETVRRIFDMYANSSKSLGGVAKILRNELGGMWNNIKLARILHNPCYVKADIDIYNFYRTKNCIIINEPDEFTGEKGCSLYGKRDRGANKYSSTEEQVLALAIHDGIVDSRTWLICQQKLSLNRQIKNTGKGKHTWLTGIVRCGYCGYSMGVVVNRGVKYLNCTGRYVKDSCSAEKTTHYVEDIEDFVTSQLRIYVESNKAASHTDRTEPPAEINGLKICLAKIEGQIENLIAALANSADAAVKYINERITRLDAERADILKKVDGSIVSRADPDLPDISSWDTLDLEGKRDIAHFLIDRIMIFNEKIEIIWKR